MSNIISSMGQWLRKRPLAVSAIYMCFYFPVFSLLEQFRQPQYFIHCAFDDVISFNEWFVIPYVIWFAFVPGMVLFFLKKNKADYFKCCKILYGGMTICLLIYWLFPTGLELRTPVENRNVLCMIVNYLRQVDTPTNVCPSIHVSSTIGILMILFGSPAYREYKKLKAGMLVTGVMICLSTMFIEQHSAVDVVCGLLLSVTLYYLVSFSNEEAAVYSMESIFRKHI